AALIFMPACSKIPFLHFGTGSGMAPPKRLLAEEDREEHAEAQGEEPESGSGGADGPDAAQFARSEARFENEAAGVAVLKKKEDEGGDSSVNEVAHERGEQCGRGTGAPVAFAGEEKRQQCQGAEIPPNEAEEPAPHDAEAEAGGFVAEQHTVGHADESADEQVNDEATAPGDMSIHARNGGESGRGEHHGAGDKSADESRQSAPFERTQKAEAGAFGLTIQGIGLDEETDPNAVDRGIRDAEDQAVKNVSYESAEEGAALVGGPIRLVACNERQQGERAEKPPENRVAEAPAHGGAKAEHVALKKQPEGRAYDYGDAEVQENIRAVGMNHAHSGKQRKKIACGPPGAKNESAQKAGKGADNDAAGPVEWGAFAAWPPGASEGGENAKGAAAAGAASLECRAERQRACRGGRRRRRGRRNAGEDAGAFRASGRPS